VRTLLQNIQDVAIEIGLPKPTAVVTSSDPTVLQLYAFMNRIGDMLVSEHDWQALAATHTLTAVALSLPATMATGNNIMTMASTSGLSPGFQASADGLPSNTVITAVNPNVSVTLNHNATKAQSAFVTFSQMDYPLPTGFHHLAPDTEYDLDNRWPIRAETPQGWHNLKVGWAANSTVAHFRVLDDKVAIYPAQPNGKEFSFEFQSDRYVVDNTGASKDKFDLDSDTCLFPDRIMVMGCKLKFWQQKGFDSTILADDFYRELSKHKGQQATVQSIRMAGYYGNGLPSMNVPDGSIGR
jgi:hypothetical protein